MADRDLLTPLMQANGCLTWRMGLGVEEYLDWSPERKLITLDGAFSAGELRAIAAHIERYQEEKKNDA